MYDLLEADNSELEALRREDRSGIRRHSIGDLKTSRVATKKDISVSVRRRSTYLISEVPAEIRHLCEPLQRTKLTSVRLAAHNALQYDRAQALR